MSLNLTRVIFASVFTIITGTTLANAGGDDSIKARQACMKANAASMGVFVPMVKGEKPYDAVLVQTTLATMETACGGWNDFWPADSKTSSALKSRSNDAVWADSKGLEDAVATYKVAFSALKATKDEAGLKAAFPVLGKSCGSCHEKFRAAE
jgi:cytochrome c556